MNARRRDPWRRVALRSPAALLFLLLGSCALHFPREVREHRRVEVARHKAPNQDSLGVPELASAVPPDTAAVPVWLFVEKLHTGLVFDLAWLERHGYRKPAGIGGHRYAAFSWGDETAYVQERWLNPGQVAHALFWPSDSVMEIIPFDWNVPEVCIHQRIYLTHVPESTGAAFAGALNAFTRTDAEGVPLTAGSSPWGDGLLIRSPYSYYFPRICNIWTVDVLNAAGFDFNGVTGLSADGVVRQALQPRNGFQQIWAPEWAVDSPNLDEP